MCNCDVLYMGNFTILFHDFVLFCPERSIVLHAYEGLEIHKGKEYRSYITFQFCGGNL